MKLSLRPREGGGRHTACQLLYGTGGLGRGTKQIKKGMNSYPWDVPLSLHFMSTL